MCKQKYKRIIKTLLSQMDYYGINNKKNLLPHLNTMYSHFLRTREIIQILLEQGIFHTEHVYSEDILTQIMSSLVLVEKYAWKDGWSISGIP